MARPALEKRKKTTMSKSRRVLTALLVVAFVAAPALAGEAGETAEANEASIEVLRQTLRSNRKAFVAVNLGLTDAEAVVFWPVYDRYQADLKASADQLVSVIEAYARTFGKTTDAEARKLVDTYLEAERDRAALRLAYFEPFSKALPGRKLMRFYQIENKIDAVLRYDIAAAIPVVE